MKKGIIGIICTLFFLALALNLFAGQKEYLFEQGNQFYKNGEYEKAAQAYEEILEMGYESADLYYNLANAYYKLGRNARAILNYERALRLRPNDEDIRFNLRLAKLSVVDKIPELPELFYVRYFKQFRELFGIRTLTILALALYFLLAAAIIGWIVARQSRVRRLFRGITFVLFIVWALFSFTLVSKIVYLQKNVEAVVMSQEVDVLSAPGKEGTEIFTIHGGLKVKIIEESGDWYEIRLADGKTGWLKKSAVELI